MQLSLIKTVHYWLKHFDLLRRSLFGEIKMIAQCLSKLMWFLIREFKIILWRRQSRSPSLRSSGRKRRLWDNPFQGGFWLAVEMVRSSILATIPGFRQRIIPEPSFPSQGSQARGTRLWRRWLNDAVWIILAQEWALSNLITAVLNIWSFFK